MGIVGITLRRLLWVKEVLGCSLAFHLSLFKDFAISGRFWLEEVRCGTVHLTLLVAFASLGLNRCEVAQLFTVAGWRLLHMLKYRVRYVGEVLKVVFFFFSVLQL